MSGRGRGWWRVAGIFVGGCFGWLLLAGCQGALVGDWHLREAVPNRQVFSIDQATFRSDGTYSATTTLEGVTTHEEGTYEFDGFRLKLRPRAGGQRTYTASLKLDQLEIGDAKRHAVLAKGTKGK